MLLHTFVVMHKQLQPSKQIGKSRQDTATLAVPINTTRHGAELLQNHRTHNLTGLAASLEVKIRPQIIRGMNSITSECSPQMTFRMNSVLSEGCLE